MKDLIAASRQALEALEVCERSDYGRNWVWPDTAHPTAMANVREAITALRTAIEAAEKQEPVAVVSGYYGGQCVIQPLNPARVFNTGTAFYTTPPAAQRKPLTDGQILEHFKETIDTGSLLSFADGVRFAEAAHGIKEKNGGAA